MPTAYRLELTVDSAADRFEGEVAIDVALQQATQRIWLHAEGLEILGAEAHDGSGSVAATFAEHEDSGFALFTAERPLGPGAATLSIRYAAPYRDELDGLYRVELEGHNYVYTDFQPLDARRAFPAFDEPRFKAPFDISVIVSGDDLAISNGPEREAENLGDGRRRFVFETTAPIPTYLVAVAVGAFDVVVWDDIPPNAVRERPVPLRGIAPKGEGDALAYALEITAPLLAILEDYFASPYPFAKLDLVAPAAFSASGMENVGAIFYRRDRILIGDSPSLEQRRGFAGLHAHELAHSWFGNLVTPAWWDDLWLNEAFATWLADKVIHAWEPGTYDDRGPLRGARWAMWSDRLVSARQIRQPILSDHDIANAFDSITYSKGAGVLAMVERYLGPEVFREGVRRFMAAHAFGVATAEDFHAALAESAGDPAISPAFRSFLEQPGTPLVTVDWQCKEGAAEVTLAQSRSLPLGSEGDPAQAWDIPLCLVWPVGDDIARHCLMLDQPTASLSLPGGGCPAWIHGNGAGAAYLDFSIPDAAWQALIQDLDRLPPAEALAAVATLGSVFEAGHVGSERFLQAAEVAARSPHWDVVKAPMQDLRDWKNFVVPAGLEAETLALLRAIYRPALHHFSLDDAALAAPDEGPMGLLRTDLIWFLALDAGDQEVHGVMARLGRTYLGLDGDGSLDPAVIHPDLVQLAIVAAAEAGGPPAVESLIERLLATDDAILRGQLIYALGYQIEPASVELVQALIFDPELPAYEAAQLLRRLGNRVANQERQFDWIVANYDRLAERLPPGWLAWMPWRASAFCTTEDRDRVEAFFAGRVEDLRGGPRNLENVLEAIAICAAIAEVQGPGAAAVLEEGG